jgi:signal transduction histidine kinase
MSAVVLNLRALALADSPVRDAALVDLSTVVTESADIVSALGEVADVTVTAQVEPRIVVRGDAVRLKQVVLNLGDNAVKYTPATGRVTIQLATGRQEAVLTVRDTGIGIAKEHVPYIFDRLYRSHTSNRSNPGMGLGLAIAKRIIDVHGGTIEVRSKVGAGSTFEVRLPLA